MRLITGMKFGCCRVSQKKQCLFLFGLCLFTILFLTLHPFVTKTANYCILFDESEGLFINRQNNLNLKLYPFFKNINDFDVSDEPDWIAYEPHLFVYTAYIDNNSVPPEIDSKYYVKLLSVVLHSYPTLKSSPIKLPCNLRYSNDTIRSMPAFIQLLPEHHNMCYRAAFIYCPVPSQDIPLEVNLAKSHASAQWTKIMSALPPSPEQSLDEISICVRPLYGPYKSISQLVEFLGYYQSMGIYDFHFYKYSVSEEVLNFLGNVSKTNKVKVTIHPWKLPNVDSYLLHSEGQLVFIQDCLLRLRPYSRYVMLLDLDEFLMPQETFNISTALAELEYDHPNAGSFLIPIVMFCEEYLSQSWPNDDVPLVTQVARRRQETPWKHTYRSKFIAKPLRLNIGGIHQIWENVYPFSTINVPSSKFMLYHYRSCCGLEQPYFLEFLTYSPLHSDRAIEDNRMLSVKDRLNNSTTVSLIRNILNAHKGAIRVNQRWSKTDNQ